MEGRLSQLGDMQCNAGSESSMMKWVYHAECKIKKETIKNVMKEKRMNVFKQNANFEPLTTA